MHLWYCIYSPPKKSLQCIPSPKKICFSSGAGTQIQVILLQNLDQFHSATQLHFLTQWTLRLSVFKGNRKSFIYLFTFMAKCTVSCIVAQQMFIERNYPLWPLSESTICEMETPLFFAIPLSLKYISFFSKTIHTISKQTETSKIHAPYARVIK